MSDANDVRGEVVLVLEGQAFVLRPSYQAIVALERKTGKPLVELATLAEQSALSLDLQAIVATELIRAWGKSAELDDYAPVSARVLVTAARGANVDTIGELLYSVGTLAVQPRLAMALGLAATGGCLPSGEMKATGMMMTTETPAAD